MDKTQKLFGKKTIQDWIDIRTKIIANTKDNSNWQCVIDLLDERLETRYFRPIERILHMSITVGEGFAVMTLVCSLLEFLQSCYEGKSYELGAKESKFVYGSSAEKFKTFLVTHEPFKPIFERPVSNPDNKIKNFADDFYSNVRCGLLHEAATKNNWVIKSNKASSPKLFVDVSNQHNKIIYRDNFVDAIKTFISNYKKGILNNSIDNAKSLRDHIARKFDTICDIKDAAYWWT